MHLIRRAGVAGLLAIWLAPLSAAADSQSSNSSSNCSNGRCTRVDSFIVEDRDGRHGWVRTEHWRQGPPSTRKRYYDPSGWRDNDD
jgi:hypothetical protein